MRNFAAIVIVGASLVLTCCTGGSANARGNRGVGGNGGQGLNPAEQTPVTTQSPHPTPEPMTAIQKLTADLGTALAQGNADQLDAILSDGYLHINDNGQLVTKPDIISGVRSGSVKFNSVIIKEVIIASSGVPELLTPTFMAANAA